MLNIYCKDGDWYTKITSLLKPGTYKMFNESNYDLAPAENEWIIALESGDDRLDIMDAELKESTIHTFFKGCNNLMGVDFGKGLTVGCCSLIRPGTTIGDQVYIGAGTIIDNNCNIGDGVNIGDNVTIDAGVEIPAYTIIPSGSVVRIDND